MSGDGASGTLPLRQNRNPRTLAPYSGKTTPSPSSRITRQRLPGKAKRKRLLEKRLERNNSRIDALDAADLKTIGEFDTTQRNGEEGTFLDDRASAFFPKPASAPDDAFPPPPWFMKAVVDVAQSIQEAPLAPPFEFQPTEAAARANAETLAKAGYDLGKIIKEHSSSTLGYGSEFRPICQLKSVIGLHPNFMALADMIENGMSYIFHRAISEDEQQAETTAMIARGDHKSAQTETDVVAKLLSKDVIHGFSIPLPVSAIPLIPHAGVQPLGLVSQWTIDENGNRIKKFRITQDLTFSSEKGLAAKSINSRINMTAYAEMVYGWCFPRILHFISALRAKYPGIVIFIAKYDYSDAYRRIAHNASAAVQTIAILPPLAYLALRLTFGGGGTKPSRFYIVL